MVFHGESDEERMARGPSGDTWEASINPLGSWGEYASLAGQKKRKRMGGLGGLGRARTGTRKDLGPRDLEIALTTPIG